MDAIYFGVDDISLYEFADDSYSKVDNLAAMSQNERIRYQADGMAILGGLVGLIFKKKDKKSRNNNSTESLEVLALSDIYNHDYYTQNFKIPEDQVEAFIAFVETSDFDSTLLENGKEMELIEHLNSESKIFLKTTIEKD